VIIRVRKTYSNGDTKKKQMPIKFQRFFATEDWDQFVFWMGAFVMYF